MKLYKEYLREANEFNVGYMFFYCLFVILDMFYTGMILSKSALNGTPFSVDKDLTDKMRKITGDNDIVVKEILLDDYINAFNDGTPDLYYSREFEKQVGLNENEIIAILLHEYGHYKEKHVSKTVRDFAIGITAFNVVIGAIMIMIPPKFFVPAYTIISNVIMNVIGYKVTNRFRRYTEFTADEYTIKYGYGKYYISGAKKWIEFLIRNYCPPDLGKDECIRRMNKRFMFDEHPPEEERIKNIEDKLAKTVNKIIKSKSMIRKSVMYYRKNI